MVRDGRDTRITRTEGEILMAKKRDKEAILSLRSALILQTAVILGVVAGWLSYLTAPVMPTAVAVGLAASGGALIVLHNIIAEN